MDTSGCGEGNVEDGCASPLIFNSGDIIQRRGKEAARGEELTEGTSSQYQRQFSSTLVPTTISNTSPAGS